MATASSLEWAWSLAIRLRTWFRTVCKLIVSVSAMTDVEVPVASNAEHLELAVGEIVADPVVGRMGRLGQSLERFGSEPRLAGGHGEDGLDDLGDGARLVDEALGPRCDGAGHDAVSLGRCHER